MEFVYFVLLGIVQGLTEFLPVSSSGHLILLEKIFKIEVGNFMLVSILLHVATLISVIILYRKEVFLLIKKPFSTLGINIILSTFVTVIVVLIFKSFFVESFDGRFLPICFMLTAIILYLTYLKTKSKKFKAYTKVNKKTAIIIGLVQGLAVLPGISRSGSTISVGTFCDIDSDTATKYSFLLSIPIIFCSLVFEIFECIMQKQQLFVGNIFYLVLSFCLALIFGIIAIKLMKKLAKTGKYYYFSAYLVIICIISLFFC